MDGDALRKWLEKICRDIVDEDQADGVTVAYIPDGGRDGDHLLLVTSTHGEARRLLVGPNGRTASALRLLVRLRLRREQWSDHVDVLVGTPER